MKRTILNGLVFACLMAITIGTFGSYKGLFNSQFFLQPNSIMATAGKTNVALMNKIKAYAKTQNEPPINAKIDRVWKAIPGYNGRAVNINASYNNMKTDNKFDPAKIVYQEISPKVNLSDLPAQPIYRGNPKKPMVSLLINVSWGSEYIPPILKTLNENHVKATFFLDGAWVKDNPKLAMMILEEGHEIGSHAYGHPDLNKKSETETLASLKKTNDVIGAALDVKPTVFAPPSGSFNQQTVEAAHSLGMKTILWTVDTIDWKHPNPDEMLQRVNQKVEAGSMILMHPTKETAESLDQMIQDIENKGYQIGTVNDLLSERRVNN